MATAEASGAWAALAALRTGPSPLARARALAFARGLAEQPRPRLHARWPSWLIGRDPHAVEDALAEAEKTIGNRRVARWQSRRDLNPTIAGSAGDVRLRARGPHSA